MKVNVVLKECNGETNLDWIMDYWREILNEKAGKRKELLK